METPKFQRNIEDFICEQCGHAVTGTGFTNHCPACLWSKHVDIHPGDRAEACGGLMEPIAVSQKKGHYRIQFRCVKCKTERWNKSAPEDDFETLLAIARMQSEGGSNDRKS
ncbi:MAG TPA: RNHCP domain-containing protein [Anaerolineales bacterium]|nr:RNHCP domain-containing protein [Anaerolineales bacterium]